MNTENLGKDNVMEGEFDLNWVAGKSIFYFDLSAALAEYKSGPTAGPQRLRLLCELRIGHIAPDELVLFQERGFFLVVNSCTGKAANAVADAINIALLKLLYGTDSFTPCLADTLYRLSTALEMAQRGVSKPPPGPCPAIVESPATTTGETDISDADSREPFARFVASGSVGAADLRLEFAPVRDLRRRTTSTFFCQPFRQDGEHTVSGAAAVKIVDRRDRPWLDEATLEQALSFARQVAKSENVVAIGASVSFETLAWSRGRRLYQNALRMGGALANPFLVVKIEDVPEGTPSMRIAEIVATVRPFTKRIVLELPAASLWSADLGQLGITGLVASLPPESSPSRAAQLAKSLLGAAYTQRAFACMAGIDDAQSLRLVRSLGVHFAYGRAAGPSIECGATAIEALTQNRDADTTVH